MVSWPIRGVYFCNVIFQAIISRNKLRFRSTVAEIQVEFHPYKSQGFARLDMDPREAQGALSFPARGGCSPPELSFPDTGACLQPGLSSDFTGAVVTQE